MSEQQPRSSFPDPPGIERLWRHDPRLPLELEDLQEFAPSCVTALGRVDLLDVRPRVAIVGTRRATSYGLRVTRELSGALARAGACIVSGMATGIDGAAHVAALDAGGSTIAILGTGLGIVFPRGHRALQSRLAAEGLLLSELEPFEHGTRWTFPKRNRLIAAISTLTIVVEAGEKSGARITSDFALDLGRSLAAVPGPIDQPQSAGTNALLRDGAHVIASVEDALALVGLTPPPRTPGRDATGDEAMVWAALAGSSMDIETLCDRSGLPAARCMAAITTLELAGSIECALDGRIRRR